MMRDGTSAASKPTASRTAGGSPRNARMLNARLGPRVVVQLPDLRVTPKTSRWMKWLAFLLAIVGGSSLTAAGSGKNSTPSTGGETLVPDDLTDPKTVARYWAIYQRFRPLVQYILSHPKTVISGALAAAAQFAAMVAWHESGSGQPQKTSADHNHSAIFDQAPPAWHPAQHYPAGGQATCDHPRCDDPRGDRGPSLGDPHWRRVENEADYRGHDGHHRTRDRYERPPHAAMNSPSQLAPQDCGEKSDRDNHVVAQETAGAAHQVALRPLTPVRPSFGALPGVAQLEGKIIPAPPREASHEPAQSSVH